MRKSHSRLRCQSIIREPKASTTFFWFRSTLSERLCRRSIARCCRYYLRLSRSITFERKRQSDIKIYDLQPTQKAWASDKIVVLRKIVVLEAYWAARPLARAEVDCGVDHAYLQGPSQMSFTFCRPELTSMYEEGKFDKIDTLSVGTVPQ